jgi:hypothetical protein
MNQAMQNSGISHSFRLVHSMSVNYTTTSNGSTSLTTDLNSLKSGTGEFAAVHTARDTYRADLVAMLVDTGSAYGYVGIGNLLTDWSGVPDSCFTVNAIQSVETSHTMTHEVGHNMGAHHSKNQTSSPGPNTFLDNQYSAGRYFTGTDFYRYHTIMAYNADGHGNSYQPAPLFSTPLLTYRGTSTGDEFDADNARLLNQTIASIAAYRTSMSSLTGLTISGPVSVDQYTSATYTATASWSDGSTGTITPIWSEDSAYATISDAGVLSILPVPSDQTITISASYTSGTDTRTDTLVVTATDIPEVSSVSFPFLETFESGTLSNVWAAKTTGTGRIKITSAEGSHRGRYHLAMDSSSTSCSYALNELVLTIDLTSRSEVELSFYQKKTGDEDHPMPLYFAGSNNSDGVAVSADGLNWYRVQGLTDADGSSGTYRKFAVDLDSVVAAAGIRYDSAFKIKFQQYDNCPMPSDGFAFDDIEIQPRFPWKIFFPVITNTSAP